MVEILEPGVRIGILIGQQGRQRPDCAALRRDANQPRGDWLRTRERSALALFAHCGTWEREALRRFSCR
jgi:hypothetical protein